MKWRNDVINHEQENGRGRGRARRCCLQSVCLCPRAPIPPYIIRIDMQIGPSIDSAKDVDSAIPADGRGLHFGTHFLRDINNQDLLRYFR